MALACALCGGELRPTSITAEGMAQACPCGRTQIVTLNQGKLEVVAPPASELPSIIDESSEK